MTHPLQTITDQLAQEVKTFIGEVNQRTSNQTDRWQRATGGAVLINASRVDLEHHAIRTVSILARELHAANTGEGDLPIPPWLGITCPGSCEQLGTLWIAMTDQTNPDLPIYCTTRDCTDRDGSLTRRSWKWLEGQASRYMDDDDRPKSIVDRLKAENADLYRRWEAAENRAERYRLQLEQLEQQLQARA